MPVEYQVDGNSLLARVQADTSHALVFRAENVRQERTGVHAKISIEMTNGSPNTGALLAWSNFNVERDEDRVRLANSAGKHLERQNGKDRSWLIPSYPANYLKNDLDQFCMGLWDAQLAQTMPEMCAGSLEPKPPEFLLYPFVLKEGGTIIFAPPGRGKSYTLLLMAVSIDAGLSALWQPVQPSKVLFINLERSARSVADRLGNVNESLALPRDRRLPMINRRGRSLGDVAAAAERYIRDNDVGVVFVDSLSRAGAGDLADNQAVNRVADVLNGMAPSWVALAHTPRGDESHLYGSVMFEAAADCVVQLLSEQEEDGPLGIGLQIVKQNDIGKLPMWTMALEFGFAGLERVRNARPGEFPDVEHGRKLTMRESLRDHLADIGMATATEIARDLNMDRSNVSRMLASDKLFSLVRKDRAGAFYGLSAQEHVANAGALP